MHGRKQPQNQKNKWKKKGESIGKEKMHITWCFNNNNNSF